MGNKMTIWISNDRSFDRTSIFKAGNDIFQQYTNFLDILSHLLERAYNTEFDKIL